MCVLSLALSGVAFFTACGSDDGKKSQPPVRPPSGGEGAAAGEGGTNGGTAGSGNAGSGVSGDAGNGMAEGGVGAAPGQPTAGAADGGAGAGGLECPAGFGDCDSNPADCETALNTVTACGGCDVSCDGSHASVSCIEGACVVDSCTDGYDDCDEDPNSGCEAKLDSDVHCGSCSRDCTTAGATCSMSTCSVEVLSPDGRAWEAAFGGGAMFVMKVNASPVSHYALTRIPLDGSAEKTIWDADGGVGDGVLFADQTDLHWAVWGSPPSVLKKSVAAASNANPAVVFQPTGMPKYLTIRGNAYFWMTGMYNGVATLFTRSTNAAMNVTGTEIMNVDQHFVSAFTTSSDAVYWVARNTGAAHLSTVPLAGGTPVDVPDSAVVDGAPLVTVGNTLYFGRTGGSTNVLNGIYRFTPGDTTVTQLVQQEQVGAIAVDDGGIYYRAGWDRVVYKAPLEGGAGVPIAKTPSGYVGFAGQDAKLLYTYSSWGSPGSAFKIVK
jgi:hypothetical protein